MGTSQSYTFMDLYGRISYYLGTGLTPSGSSLAIAKKFANDGYRMYLRPLDPRTKRLYLWSFLSPASVLYTGKTVGASGGTWLQTLPADFGGIVDDPAYDSSAVRQKVAPRSPAYIRQARGSQVLTGQPQFYAIEPVGGTTGGSASALQNNEIMFWPTPDSNYTLHYRYRSRIVLMDADDDCPLGGPEHSLTILQAGLMLAERHMNERAGEQAALYQEMLVASIDLDAGMKAQNLGGMEERSDDSFYDPRNLILGPVTYNV